MRRTTHARRHGMPAERSSIPSNAGLTRTGPCPSPSASAARSTPGRPTSPSWPDSVRSNGGHVGVTRRSRSRTGNPAARVDTPHTNASRHASRAPSPADARSSARRGPEVPDVPRTFVCRFGTPTGMVPCRSHAWARGSRSQSTPTSPSRRQPATESCRSVSCGGRISPPREGTPVIVSPPKTITWVIPLNSIVIGERMATALSGACMPFRRSPS